MLGILVLGRPATGSAIDVLDTTHGAILSPRAIIIRLLYCARVFGRSYAGSGGSRTSIAGTRLSVSFFYPDLFWTCRFCEKGSWA